MTQVDLNRVGVAVIEHHLRLLGCTADTEVLHAPDEGEVARALAAAAAGHVVVADAAGEGFCARLGLASRQADVSPSAVLRYAVAEGPWRRLRTLHPYRLLSGYQAHPAVVDAHGDSVWMWVPVEAGGILVVGTELAADLVRYRQGDPARARFPDAGPIGGIPGERPIYLFEPQLDSDQPWDRPADHWAMALSHLVAEKSGRQPTPLLPGGAPGAIVVTADDDQAYLETYEAQLALLRRTPITYFLHPLTKHTRASIRTLQKRAATELAIHPDALDAPKRYADLLHEQIRWYVKLVGKRPVSLRNHGFLNDGYWGHLDSWLREGIRISSNIPGLDGRVLNGSLLPARLAQDATLTDHWSILTAIGDGVVFIHGWSDERAASLIHDYAARIRSSGLPGVMVVNLHPQNIDRTSAMHRATAEVAEGGFHAWTLAECLQWFEARDTDRGRDQAGGSFLKRLAASKLRR